MTLQAPVCAPAGMGIANRSRSCNCPAIMRRISSRSLPHCPHDASRAACLVGALATALCATRALPLACCTPGSGGWAVEGQPCSTALGRIVAKMWRLRSVACTLAALALSSGAGVASAQDGLYQISEFDADESGSLEPKEFTKFLQTTPAKGQSKDQVRGMFKRIDSSEFSRRVTRRPISAACCVLRAACCVLRPAS
jgi:hypothetical protein